MPLSQVEVMTKYNVDCYCDVCVVNHMDFGKTIYKAKYILHSKVNNITFQRCGHHKNLKKEGWNQNEFEEKIIG